MGKRILVIDDDLIVSKTLKMLLHKSGYEVSMADSGRKALDLIRENKFDLIISDIRMPGMSGIETLKKLRESEKEGDAIIPAVIITGYAGEGQYFPDEALGVRDYLYKPFDNKELLEMVKKALEYKTKSIKEEVYPRLKINFPIRIPPAFLTQGIHVKDIDMESILSKPRLVSSAKVEMEISPEENIERAFKVIWAEKLIERKKFKYSGAFIRFKEKDLDLLMDVLLTCSAEAITKDLKEQELKNKVLEFWQISFKKFLKGIDKLNQEMQDKAQIDEQKFLYFEKAINDLIEKAENLTKKINDKKITRKMKKTLRYLGGDWFYQSEIMMKGFKKIRGYPGDFEMMNFVYNNNLISNNPVGLYFDKYFLNNAYAAAVRGRKNKMVEILEKQFKTLQDKTQNFKLLNLACGPSREIQELFLKELNVQSNVNYICLDLDKEALDFSKKALKNIPGKVKMKFFQENILELLKKPEQYQSKLGNCDIVYSIGLADYLPDKIMRKMINAGFKLLKSKGSLILAFKITDKDPFAPVPPDWFCDWRFVPRSEDDVEELIKTAQIENYSVSKEWEETGKIEYFFINRNR